MRARTVSWLPSVTSPKTMSEAPINSADAHHRRARQGGRHRATAADRRPPAAHRGQCAGRPDSGRPSASSTAAASPSHRRRRRRRARRVDLGGERHHEHARRDRRLRRRDRGAERPGRRDLRLDGNGDERPRRLMLVKTSIMRRWPGPAPLLRVGEGQGHDARAAVDGAAALDAALRLDIELAQRLDRQGHVEAAERRRMRPRAPGRRATTSLRPGPDCGGPSWRPGWPRRRRGRARARRAAPPERGGRAAARRWSGAASRQRRHVPLGRERPARAMTVIVGLALRSGGIRPRPTSAPARCCRRAAHRAAASARRTRGARGRTSRMA